MRSSATILQLFGRDLQAMDGLAREQWTDRAFRYWREAGFPYQKLVPDEVAREFRLLRSSRATEIFREDELKAATTGLRLANSFHPQMWHVRSQQHRLAP